MQLIGMLDSPYVRRVAITLQALNIPFEHRSLSIFRDINEFGALNPVIKAPTLICLPSTYFQTCLISAHTPGYPFCLPDLRLSLPSLKRQWSPVGSLLSPKAFTYENRAIPSPGGDGHYLPTRLSSRRCRAQPPAGRQCSRT